LFYSGGRVLAQGFDLDRGQTIGDPFPLTDIAHRTFVGTMLADFSATRNGALVYPPMAHVNSNLVWRDRTGKILRKSAIAAGYHSPRIAPDGTRVAFGKYDGNNTDIWIEELRTQTLTRFTFDAGIEQHPVWSPDGKTLVYTSDASGRSNLYRRLASGGGEPARISDSPYEQQAMDWASDGSHMLFTQIRQSAEIMARPKSGNSDLSFLGHALGATGPQFNPGVPRWISYAYDDSGRREVYVQGFTPGQIATKARWQISSEGGFHPRWRGDGKELFYISLDGRMNAVEVDGSGTAFRSSKPVELFRTSPPQMRHPDFTFDVTRDGQRFVIIEPAYDLELLPLTLVTDWAALR
jgi:dipeptidyl aminopeptidase/acylaminoacyl peptidase